MSNILKFFLICFYVFIPFYTFADDICSKYKFDVDVNVNIDDGNVEIKQSDEDLVGLLGYASPKYTYSMPYQTAPIHVHGGYCVSLRWVDINIVQRFQIVIDKNLKKDSCTYNVVLKHEQNHVNAYKTILNDNIDYIKKSVYDATKHIEPVFIEDLSELNTKVDFYKNIKESDVVKKMMDDIKNKIEEENNKIDESGDDYDIWKCDDFYENVRKTYKKTRIIID